MPGSIPLQGTLGQPREIYGLEAEAPYKTLAFHPRTCYSIIGDNGAVFPVEVDRA
jgi:hypothetical protein